jgi:hypothetical protein
VSLIGFTSKWVTWVHIVRGRDHDLNIFLQGAKAQQKRERNADKNAPKGSKSQAKVNEAAKSIVCQTCKKPFASAPFGYLI